MLPADQNGKTKFVSQKLDEVSSIFNQFQYFLSPITVQILRTEVVELCSAHSV